MFGEMAAGLLLSEGFQSYKIVGSVVIIGGVVLVAANKQRSHIYSNSSHGTFSSKNTIRSASLKYDSMTDIDEDERIHIFAKDNMNDGPTLTTLEAIDIVADDSSEGDDDLS